MLIGIFVVIFACFTATSLNAESIAPSGNNISSTSDSTTYVFDDELVKISKSCLLPSDHAKLTGYLFKPSLAVIFNIYSIPQAVAIIGLAELRAALDFPPPGNWTNYKSDPTEEEFKATTTVEEYFYLKEPRTRELSLDSDWFSEYMFPPIIAFIDDRFPAVRRNFKHTFQEILHNNKGSSVDRKIVDQMIEEFEYARIRVKDAMVDMMTNNYECAVNAIKALNN